MPLQLIAPIYETLTLDKADKNYGNTTDSPTTIIVRQARQHEHERRQQLFAKVERKWNNEDDPDEIRVVQELSQAEVYREEAWLTLVECNILDPNGDLLFNSSKDKEGHPRLAMDRQSFYRAWGILFPDIATEIIEKIHEVNPLWGGPLEKAG